MKTTIFCGSSFSKNGFDEVLNYFLNNLKSKSTFELEIGDNFDFFKVRINHKVDTINSYIVNIRLHNGNNYGTPNPGHVWIEVKYVKKIFSYCKVLGINGSHSNEEEYDFHVSNDEELEKGVGVLNSIIQEL